MRSLFFSNNILESLVGKITFIHNEKDSSSPAYEISEAAKIRILLPRLLGVVSASARIFTENLNQELTSFPPYGLTAKTNMIYMRRSLTRASLE